MKKTLFYTGVVLVFLFILGAFLLNHTLLYDNADNANETNNANDASEIEDDFDDKEEPMDNSSIELVDEVFQCAIEGRVPGESVIAGKSNIGEIKSEWGEPLNSITAGDGVYIDYEDTNFGYTKNTVFDVRSFHNDLQEIKLEDIKQEKGNPDEERYYEDEQVDQIILVYNVSENYQLKWILPLPTDANPNPAVHHISVYTDVANIEMDAPSLVESMSLDEKIGQMIMAGIEGTTTNPETIKLIEDYKVGGVIFFSENLTSVGQSLDLVNGLKRTNASNKVPLFLSVDQEGGRVERLPGIEGLPTNQEISQRENPKLSYQIGKILGQELKAFGMNLNFAPVMDVNSNPNNPVIGDRSFSNDPSLVSKLGVQTIKGMADENVISVIKHFPGHGDTSVDSHLELPKIDKSVRELQQMELIPFTNAINEGADMVMVAHILFPQLDEEYPSSMSKPIITDVLRNELNFDGVVITDDMVMDAIDGHYHTGNAAVKSVKAGSDIILVSRGYDKIVETFEAMKQAVTVGEIGEERINESVNRIIALKQKYGLNDKEVAYQDIAELNESIKKIAN
ncbi:beta-N-acetylhexosaminidase [Salinibacillus kushneri]|uniref:beta-N-acetylhexosaminidase n=1 Tax=Salinibacillus kushneri TaxID=237682 RepID=A0A1I0GK62_9BACI|nr:beta-N-acetylhexosaminidase [Salinibacillus kushneri]SET71335.1 beta-N-acetylhexosaminidase [Salinibacillus kushneri]